MGHIIMVRLSDARSQSAKYALEHNPSGFCEVPRTMAMTSERLTREDCVAFSHFMLDSKRPVPHSTACTKCEHGPLKQDDLTETVSVAIEGDTAVRRRDESASAATEQRIAE